MLRGNLLVVPIDNTILYVEPVFLQADNLAFPELKQVIVADAGEVVMRPTLQAALDALTGSSTPAPSLDRPVPVADTGPPPEAGSLQEALGDASDAIDSLDMAFEELRRTLEELNRLAGSNSNEPVH